MPVDLYVCRTCKGSKALVAGIERRTSGDRTDAAGPGGVAAEHVEVHLVRCQGICKGAVAGLEVDGRLTWFRRLRGDKAAKALVKLARRSGRAPVPKRLVAHHVARRDGRRVKR